MNAHEPQNDAEETDDIEEYDDIDFDALLDDDDVITEEFDADADESDGAAPREYSQTAYSPDENADGATDFAAENRAASRREYSQDEKSDDVERLQKLIARAGVASRRAAEEMIAAGRVTVNDQVVREAGFKASRRDRIVVDGRVLRFPSGPATVILLHKPLHVVTTKSDPEGRVTVADYLPPKYAHLHPVGRLDFDTSGLLLFTDDGELTQLLTHPSHAVEKVYLARVRGQVALSTIKKLEAGVFLEDGKTAPCRVRLRAQTEKNALLQITLREGRNRQVRRMLDHVGHPARALRRVKFGNLSLEDIPAGAYRILLGAEAHELKKLATRGPKKTPQRPTSTRAKIADSGPKTPRASTRTAPKKAPVASTLTATTTPRDTAQRENMTRRENPTDSRGASQRANATTRRDASQREQATPRDSARRENVGSSAASHEKAAPRFAATPERTSRASTRTPDESAERSATSHRAAPRAATSDTRRAPREYSRGEATRENNDFPRRDSPTRGGTSSGGASTTRGASNAKTARESSFSQRVGGTSRDDAALGGATRAPHRRDDAAPRDASSTGKAARENTPREYSSRAAATRRDSPRARAEEGPAHPLAQRIERSFERGTTARGERDFSAKTRGEYSREGAAPRNSATPRSAPSSGGASPRETAPREARPPRGATTRSAAATGKPAREANTRNAETRRGATGTSGGEARGATRQNYAATAREERRDAAPSQAASTRGDVRAKTSDAAARAPRLRDDNAPRAPKPRGSGALHDSKQPRTDRKPRGGGKNSRAKD